MFSQFRSSIPRSRAAVRPSLRIRLAATLATAAAATCLVAAERATAATNPITPGNLTGYAFDQCEAPNQTAMDRWLEHSPYRGVGIYISGSLRFCQEQRNLTPTWVRTQLAKGWRLLPLHVGRQASCSTRERYLPRRISADPRNDYLAAKAQGRGEADIAAKAARALGITPGSVIFYDLEAFDVSQAGCRFSALKFLSAWTTRLASKGYFSGVYSSAASGIKMLDDARVRPGNTIVMPRYLWIAEWNGTATTSSSYVRPDGWPNRRIHQFRGSHTETWGGSTINIDSNWMQISGTGYPKARETVRDPKCTRTSMSKLAYRDTSPAANRAQHMTLQCFLRAQSRYDGLITARWDRQTTSGVNSWQTKAKRPVRLGFTRGDWVSLLVAGHTGTRLRLGATGADVVRVQRALNAATDLRVPVSGTFNSATRSALVSYQKQVGIPATAIVDRRTWAALAAGAR